MWARVALLTVVGLETLWIVTVFGWHALNNPAFGLDYRWHVDASRRLLELGTPYWPWQVASPYEIGNGAILYPPVAFALFIPFLWLPPVLWWAIPIGIVVAVLVAHRPPLPALALILGLISYEKSLNPYVFGNPAIWIVAAVALGTVWGWPAVLVLAKPTFAPFALIGIRRRSWWVALAGFAAVSALFGGLWIEWAKVAMNSNVSLAYNILGIPLMVAPVIAWLTGVRRPAWIRAIEHRYPRLRSRPIPLAGMEASAGLSSTD